MRHPTPDPDQTASMRDASHAGWPCWQKHHVLPIYINAAGPLIFGYKIASVCGILVASRKQEACLDP